MTPSTVSIIALALPMLASLVKGVERVTVDAAMKDRDGFLLLFAGNKFLVLWQDEEEESGDIFDLEFPTDVHYTAATDTLQYGHLNIYGRDYYYDFFSVFGLAKDKKKDYTPSEQEFFGNSGPDAVATCNGQLFFFKGCKVAKEKRWSEAENVAEFGLPCEPDAAWKTSARDGMVVLKGDQLWLWDCHGRIAEQISFSSMYTIRSWELIPSTK